MSLDDVRTPSLARVRDLGEPVPVDPPPRRGPGGDQARPRFKLRLASELTLRTSGAWCIKHVLPGDGFGLLYGPSTAGKSFVALDLAAHIVTGKPWNGHRVERGAVVYVALEGQADAETRLIALRAHHDLDGAPLLFVADPLNLADQGDAKAKRLPEPVELARLIAEKARELREPVRLVIVDTLARASGGLNENDASEMSIIVAAAEAIKDTLGCMVILVHHAPWDESRPRGSSALYAAADVVLGVKRDGEARTLKVEKLKPWRDGETWAFALDVVELGEDDDGDPITSCVPAWSDAPAKAPGAKLSKRQHIALTAFRNVAARGTVKYRDDTGREHEAITWDAWRVEMRALGASEAKDAKGQDRGARALRDALVTNGVVRFRDGFAWLPDWEGNAGNEGEIFPSFPHVGEGKEGKSP